MTSPLRLERGSVFAGDFKVIRPLRTGGQGSLYVVEQVSTSKHRALKLMLPELVAQPAARRRFELEARVAARIPSDHVVESIASGVDVRTGVPWLVMELLEGEDLAAQLQKRRRLPPGEVLQIFDQLCHALGEAHKQGIVHRDLKPENIFLATPRRRGVSFVVKVLDFGIARVVAESQTQSGQTTTGLGTPMWMAPEQTMPGGPVAPSTDVWPLGLLAFRLLTGYLFWKTPYEPGGSVMMLMAEAFMHPMPTASERAAHYKCPERIPPGFDAWFGKCLSRAMEQRYANAAEVFASLEPVLAPFAEPSPGSRASIEILPVLDPRAKISAEPPAVTPSGRTGPSLPTWGGAPELSDSAMLSDVESAAGAQPGTTGPRAAGAAHPGSEHAPHRDRRPSPTLPPYRRPSRRPSRGRRPSPALPPYRRPSRAPSWDRRPSRGPSWDRRPSRGPSRDPGLPSVGSPGSRPRPSRRRPLPRASPRPRGCSAPCRRRAGARPRWSSAWRSPSACSSAW